MVLRLRVTCTSFSYYKPKIAYHWGQWIRRVYISPNEIIKICGNTALRQLLHDIYVADYFALIADKATDLSWNECASLNRPRCYHIFLLYAHLLAGHVCLI